MSLELLFSGTAGAILGAVLCAYLTPFFQNYLSKEIKGAAHDFLNKDMDKYVTQSNMKYFFCQTLADNYKIANRIYSHADAHIISTSFHENPAIYGESDLARNCKYTSQFKRITCEHCCPKTEFR